jgi:hypothetical protein
VSLLSIFAICRDTWFIYFETSQYFIAQKEVFSTFEEFTLSHKIYLGDNSTLDVCKKSNIVFNLPNGNMLYVPKLANNILSITQLT